MMPTRGATGDGGVWLLGLRLAGAGTALLLAAAGGERPGSRGRRGDDARAAEDGRSPTVALGGASLWRSMGFGHHTVDDGPSHVAKTQAAARGHVGERDDRVVDRQAESL